MAWMWIMWIPKFRQYTMWIICGALWILYIIVFKINLWYGFNVGSCGLNINIYIHYKVKPRRTLKKQTFRGGIVADSMIAEKHTSELGDITQRVVPAPPPPPPPPHTHTHTPAKNSFTPLLEKSPWPVDKTKSIVCCRMLWMVICPYELVWGGEQSNCCLNVVYLYVNWSQRPH